MNNPYSSQEPIFDGKMFYGREEELNEIGAFIRGNQSVSIIGPKKIGKTSLMLHLIQPETLGALGLAEGYLFVYIDCQALSGRRQEEIFANFCSQIAEALQAQGLEPEPALTSAINHPTWLKVEVALRRLNQRGFRVVLILDGFECLTMNPNLGVKFYNGLRSAAGRLRLVYITGSTRPLIELTYFDSPEEILSSPFFNIFAQVYLGFLSGIDAGKLIRIPMEAAGIFVSEQLERFIYQLVGGHPLGLQIACSHAWDSPEDFQKIELRTVQDLEAHFQSDWHNLSLVEKDILGRFFEAGIHADTIPDLMITLRDLTRKCLLIRTGESYEYPSKAWAEYVSAHI